MVDRKLRVMVLAPVPYFSDCGRHVRIYEQARALTQLGHRVRIVTYHSGRHMPGVQVDRINHVPWCKSHHAVPFWQRPFLDVLVYCRALRVAREFRPHLIHAHLHEGAWIGGRLKKRLRLPLLFDCQGSLSDDLLQNGLVGHSSLLHCFVEKFERRMNHGNADYIITRSRTAASELAGRWGVDETRVGTLLDGVNTAHFRPHVRSEVRRELGLPQDVPIGVYLGLMEPSSGIDVLLSAIVQLKAKESPVRFLAMGYPEEGCRKKAMELGIGRMITFTGRIDYARAPFCLSAGDLAVSPGFSAMNANGKLLTYMACGLPTVAFKTHASQDLLGEAGIYADSGDESQLAARIAWLVENSEERTRLGRMLRKRADQQHSWDARCLELDEIYRAELGR